MLDPTITIALGEAARVVGASVVMRSIASTDAEESHELLKIGSGYQCPAPDLADGQVTLPNQLVNTRAADRN
jgi:hypothetical protein